MSYRRLDVSLAAVIAPEQPRELLSRDVRITEVFITKALGSFSLRFGQIAPDIDIDAPISFEPEGDEQRQGLYLTNAVAQAGVIQTIYIVTAGNTLNAKPEQ